MKGVRREQETFAGSKGVWHCFWGVRKGKKRVYDFFAADVRFFVNLNFMYIFIIIFEG